MNVFPKTSVPSVLTHSKSTSSPGYSCLPSSDQSAAALLAILIATGGVALSGQSALAQVASNVTYDPISGAVQVDNNAFDLQTGALQNDSDIPLPALLPTETRERMAQPVVDGKFAPNTVELTPDVNYINQSFNEILQNSDNGSGENPTSERRYDINAESLEVTTQFNLSQRRGSHAYGEGIEVTVFDENGEVVRQESTFVRGGRVKIGPDGQPLPESSQLNVSYGAGDRVQLRVLNLRRNGAEPSESGIYFNNDGEFIVEDRQNGGDLDFDDGNYLSISEGRGAADGIEARDVVSVETETSQTPLEPEFRVEQVVEEEIIENVVESDTVAMEEREWGSVSLPDELPATRLGHAESAIAQTGEILVYDRYTGGSQLRAGSDGLGFTGQLKPLVNNPNVPPTLLSGNLTFNPFVGDNEAGLTGSLGVTQFITPTHRLATDALGNVIDNPNADGPRLVEPGGLFTNRRLVGYVPPTPEETVFGNQLFSTGGVFRLPADQSVVINPADAQKVGRGNAAYTNNVGGVLIESANGGAMSFVPQWTAAGYAQETISLEAGEASRVIYALVPQQDGQNLALGQSYDVTEVAGGYEITAGGFSIISADRQPQNFVEETTEVYAVEDTVPGNNAVTALFNGIQGVYAEAPGAPRVSTVDVGLASEADARVGNVLFPVDTIAGDLGQRAYGQTTRAAGFYLGGSVTGGIGNQQDAVTSTTIEMDQVVEELQTRRTLRTFETPIVQLDTVVTQRTETTEGFGQAFFDINKLGELTNVNFIEGDSQTTSVANDLLETKTSTIRGEETLVSEVTTETTELLGVDMVEMDRESNDGSDSYANFSAVQGELALGGVLNFGNTPWSSAANTVRAELFAQDTVIGRGGNGSEVGWRAEALFHPFGEVQREAYQYDADGNTVPVYRTVPVMDANGEQVVETLTGANGERVDVLVNAFELDADGNRVQAMVGTGKAKGPGVYVRVEDAFGDDDGVVVAGGLQLSF